MVKINKSDRAIIPRKLQRGFLVEARKRLKASDKDLAKVLSVSPRTVRDWTNEKYSLSVDTIKKISELSTVATPPYEIRSQYWYVHKGAKLGGQKTYEKYGYAFGNPEKRLSQWKKWWEKTGKFKKVVNRKTIKKPKRSKELAEFVGILLGDGGISERQVIVSLNNATDKEYTLYVHSLIHKLFGVKASINPRKGVLVSNITVSRTDLVDYCISIGLVKGNKIKQKIDIPDWIKKKPLFSKYCIRGLIDTDGSIFNECHRIKGQLYCYPRLSLVSYSQPLRESVCGLLRNLGFNAKLRTSRAVSIENAADIERYFRIIRTSNLKHRVRFEKFRKRKRA